MKRLIKALVIILLSNHLLNAQIIRNGDFEIWENPLPNVERPWFWTTADSLIAAKGNNIQTVHKTTDAYGGLYALKITPLKCPTAKAPCNAVVCFGTSSYIDTNDYYVYGTEGDSINYDLLAIKGYYKFVPDTNSAERALIGATIITDEFPFSPTDGIISGGGVFLDPSDTFKQFVFVMEKWANEHVNVDSLTLGVEYRSENMSATPSGYLIIDELRPVALVYPTSVRENKLKNEIAYCITPQAIAISSKTHTPFAYSLYDINGRLINKADKLLGHNIPINTLARGMYILNIKSSTGFLSLKLSI